MKYSNTFRKEETIISIKSWGMVNTDEGSIWRWHVRTENDPRGCLEAFIEVPAKPEDQRKEYLDAFKKHLDGFLYEYFFGEGPK